MDDSQPIQIVNNEPPKKVENLLEMEEPQNNEQEKKPSVSLLDLEEPAEKKYSTSINMQQPETNIYSTQINNGGNNEINFFEPPQN